MLRFHPPFTIGRQAVSLRLLLISSYDYSDSRRAESDAPNGSVCRLQHNSATGHQSAEGAASAGDRTIMQRNSRFWTRLQIAGRSGPRSKVRFVCSSISCSSPAALMNS